MTNTLTIGERISWYRRRRGVSQTVLAGMVGRTEDWVSKVENNHIDVDRLSVLRALADALDVSLGDLLCEPSLMEWTPESGQTTVPALRAAIMNYRQITPMLASEPTRQEPTEIPVLRQRVSDVWDGYQAAKFGYVTNMLPPLVQDLYHTSHAHNGSRRRQSLGLLALSYQVAGLTLTKVGETDLAWMASDRGFQAAEESDNELVIASLFRSVTHSLLSNGRYEEAVEFTDQAIRHMSGRVDDNHPEAISLYGSLLLAGAMAAARADDRRTTTGYLTLADRAAERLGRDANHFGTAFGPTNVAIHRVNTAMELGDVQVAVDLGPQVDTSKLPTERQVRHALDVARAYNARNQTDAALNTLLDVEKIGPEQVRYHFISRQLVQGWIRRTRSKPSHHLTRLAKRLQVV